MSLAQMSVDKKGRGGIDLRHGTRSHGEQERMIACALG